MEQTFLGLFELISHKANGSPGFSSASLINIDNLKVYSQV